MFDLLRLQRRNRGQAQAVEFLQRDLIHHARLMESLRRVADGFKNG